MLSERKPLRRYPSVWGIVIGVITFASFWTVLVLGQTGTPLPGSLWVDGAMAKKQALAEAIRVPKIAIVAGSNALFGVRSPLLERAWGRPVINLAVNAGLLLPLILEQAKPALRKGDIVLMPLEYPLYNYHGEINQVLVDYLLSRRDRLVRESPWTITQVIFEAPLRRVIEGYHGLPTDFRLTGLYGPHMIDGWGDQIGTDIAKRTSAYYAEALASPVRHYGHEIHRRAEGWTLLRNFKSWADARNICLILLPPAFMRRDAYMQDAVERRFYKDLPARARRNGLIYLGAPLNEMQPPEDFFNTDYHLIDEARTAFTNRIIQLIGPDPITHCGFRSAGAIDWHNPR